MSRSVVVAVLLALSITLLTGRSEARPKKKAPCVSTLSECLKKPAGCGGDPDLNMLKNRTTAASSPEEWTVQDVIDLESSLAEVAFPSETISTFTAVARVHGKRAPRSLHAMMRTAGSASPARGQSCPRVNNSCRDYYIDGSESVMPPR